MDAEHYYNVALSQCATHRHTRYSLQWRVATASDGHMLIHFKFLFFFSSCNLNYFVAGFRFGRRPLQNATCNFLPRIICGRCHHQRRRRRRCCRSPPPNAVCKLNKYIDTFSEFVFVHRAEFRITFFWSVSAFASHVCDTVDARVEKSNIFSWLKINWMNLSQLYCAREVRADARLLLNANYFFSVRACARATVEKMENVDIDINCSCQM